MKKTLLLILLFICTIHQLQAQSNFNGAGYFGIDFIMGAPMGEYKTYNDRLSAGLNLNFFYQPSIDIPLMVGLDLGFMGNGSEYQDETLYVDLTVGGTVIDQMVIPFSIETHNNIFNGHFLLRAMAPIKYFKPYVDGIVGFQNFSTTTSIYDESEEHYFSEEDNPLITTKTQLSDWALAYGGAFGFLVQCNENFFINLRCAYLLGSKADYYTDNDIQNWDIEFSANPSSPDDLDEDDISVHAIPKHSETDVLMPSLGITFRF